MKFRQTDTPTDFGSHEINDTPPLNCSLSKILHHFSEIFNFRVQFFDIRADGTYRGDVFNVFPGFIGTVLMRVIEPGDWLLHCHVFDHLHSGMQTIYSVTERGSLLMICASDLSVTVIKITIPINYL